MVNNLDGIEFNVKYIRDMIVVIDKDELEELIEFSGKEPEWYKN